jgi:hypothetical protein
MTRSRHTPKRDRRTRRQQLDHYEAVEHEDWLETKRRREREATPECQERKALAERYKRRR